MGAVLQAALRQHTPSPSVPPTSVPAACLWLTDAGVLQLSTLGSLRSLNLGGCKGVSGAGSTLAALALGCPLLSRLSLEDCPRVGDEAVAQGVSAMTALVSLNLGGCR